MDIIQMGKGNKMERTMYLEGIERISENFIRKEFPYREYGYIIPDYGYTEVGDTIQNRSPRIVEKGRIYPIQRDGFSIFSNRFEDSHITILPEDISRLEEIKSPYTKVLIKKLDKSLHHCFDEDCDGSFFEYNITVKDLRLLLLPWNSGMPEWLYRDICGINWDWFLKDI